MQHLVLFSLVIDYFSGNLSNGPVRTIFHDVSKKPSRPIASKVFLSPLKNFLPRLPLHFPAPNTGTYATLRYYHSAALPPRKSLLCVWVTCPVLWLSCSRRNYYYCIKTHMFLARLLLLCYESHVLAWITIPVFWFTFPGWVTFCRWRISIRCGLFARCCGFPLFFIEPFIYLWIHLVFSSSLLAICLVHNPTFCPPTPVTVSSHDICSHTHSTSVS